MARMRTPKLTVLNLHRAWRQLEIIENAQAVLMTLVPPHPSLHASIRMLADYREAFNLLRASDAPLTPTGIDALRELADPDHNCPPADTDEPGVEMPAHANEFLRSRD